MGSLIKGFTKPPLKQWVIYQGVDVCTGIVVSRKFKIIRKKNFSQKLLEVKESYLKTSKFTKKCMASGRRVGHRPDYHTFLCKF